MHQRSYHGISEATPTICWLQCDSFELAVSRSFIPKESPGANDLVVTLTDKEDSALAEVVRLNVIKIIEYAPLIPLVLKLLIGCFGFHHFMSSTKYKLFDVGHLSDFDRSNMQSVVHRIPNGRPVNI